MQDTSEDRDLIGQISDQKEPTIEDHYQAILKRGGRDGCGLYQVIVCSAVMTGITGFNWIFYGLGFLELFPQFDCHYSNGTTVYECTSEDICLG